MLAIRSAKTLLSMLQSAADTSQQDGICAAPRRNATQWECIVSDAHSNESIPRDLKAFAVVSNSTVMSMMVRGQCNALLRGLQLLMRQWHVPALTRRLQGLAAGQHGRAEPIVASAGSLGQALPG